MTHAEQAAEFMGNDGQDFTRFPEAVAAAYLHEMPQGHRRYEFSDGSTIVVCSSGEGWDIGFSDRVCACWIGSNLGYHEENCAAID